MLWLCLENRGTTMLWVAALHKVTPINKALSWTLSSSFISLLYWEAQKWTQPSSCGLTSAERKDHFSRPTDSTPTNAATKVKSFPASWPPAHTGAWGCSSPGRYRPWHFPLLIFTRFLWAHFSSLSRSLSSNNPVVYQPLLPLPHEQETCWGCNLSRPNFSFNCVSFVLGRVTFRK